jgi:phosphinothricin acetyltransferase
VAEADGTVIAFAATFPTSHRCCYAGNAEFSVYVEREARGQGAGRVAMTELIAAARAAGFTKLLSRVFVENAASRKLLRGVGFREIGIYERHARLDGIWRDLVSVEQLLHRGGDLRIRCSSRLDPKQTEHSQALHGERVQPFGSPSVL